MADAQSVEAEAKPITVVDLMKMANDYHVPVSHGTLSNIAGGEEEVPPAKATAFEEHLQNQAAGLYPTLAPQIMAGIKTSDLLEPYRQIGKQVMGEDFEPNFQTDPHSRVALHGGLDPQTGRPAPMTLDAWQTHLRSDPVFGYMDTPQGQAEHADMLRKIGEVLTGGQQ